MMMMKKYVRERATEDGREDTVLIKDENPLNKLRDKMATSKAAAIQRDVETLVANKRTRHSVWASAPRSCNFNFGDDY